MKLKSFSFYQTVREFEFKGKSQRISTACCKRLPSTLATMNIILPKKESGQILALEEWLVLIGFAQRGAERRGKRPNRELLVAFASVFAIRALHAKDACLTYYLHNLPERCQPHTLECGRTTPETVRKALASTLAALAHDETETLWPLLPARNLQALVEFEPLETIEALNKALLPHWDLLWNLASAVVFQDDEVRQ